MVNLYHLLGFSRFCWFTMQGIPRWRNALILQNSLIQSKIITTQLAHLHSTPSSSEKQKEKRNFDARSYQRPSKRYLKYLARQRRADSKRERAIAKKAIQDFTTSGSKFALKYQIPKGEGRTWNTEHPYDSNSANKKSKWKFSAGTDSKVKRKKCKLKRDFSSDDGDDIGDNAEKIFQDVFGNRWQTSAHKFWKEYYFQKSTYEFQWGKSSYTSGGRNRAWWDESGTVSDNESYTVGPSSDRTILGLSSKGPLKIEEVKNAFRMSALKWHPDKHQGPSKATAEDKFKLCVNAYKTLCKELSSS